MGKAKRKKETISAEAELWHLNQKQFDFCNEYTITKNGEQSAIKVGYSLKSARQQASRMLTNANVQKYLEELRKRTTTETIASAKQVLESISKIALGQETEKETFFVGDKEVTKEKQLKTSDRLKALELLGKHYALFTDKTEVSGNVDVVIIDDVE